MNIFDKIIKLWWVILSFIVFMNGLGFIHTGLKHNNENWIIEGVIYEIPWIFYIVYYVIFGYTSLIIHTNYVLLLAFLLMLVSIIRSFWVAIKLWDVYDNNDKYAQNPTELVNPNKVKGNNGISKGSVCCLCIAVIFFLFALAVIIL